MDCEKYLQLISQYLDSELSEIERESFEEHINKCEKCKKELEIYNKIIMECNLLNIDEPLPNNYHNQLMSKLKTVKKQTNIITISKITAYASVIIVLVMLSFVLLNTSFHNKSYTEDSVPRMEMAENVDSQQFNDSSEQEIEDNTNFSIMNKDTKEGTIEEGATEEEKFTSEEANIKSERAVTNENNNEQNNDLENTFQTNKGNKTENNLIFIFSILILLIVSVLIYTKKRRK